MTNETSSWLVSVIVPVYNVLPFLKEAMDSVINQTYRNLEIIVIDDGSTDGSGEVCDRYAENDARIRVIHQPNRGLSAARNAGLDVMTGQVVAFLDSDDALHPDMIRRMLNAMIRNRADIVVCDRTKQYTTGPMRPNRSDETTDQGLAEGSYDRIKALQALADGQLITVVWDKLYRSLLWNELQFPIGLVHEDRHTVFKVLDLVRTVYVLRESLYLHRIRQGSINESHTLVNLKDWIIAQKQWEAFVEEHIPDIFTQEQLKRLKMRILRSALKKYSQLPSVPSENKAADEKLREQIKAFGEPAVIRECTFKTRAAWWTVSHCPWLIRLAGPIYLALRK